MHITAWAGRPVFDPKHRGVRQPGIRWLALSANVPVSPTSVRCVRIACESLPWSSLGHKATVLTDQPMNQSAAWLMIRRRAAAAGILAPIGNHTFRATGITAYLGNGGALEHAQSMAAHESPRTTKLYDRTKDRLTQN